MIRQSEIIGQKLKFIFSVEETTEHVLPKEQFMYYIFIKNISGVNIENFKIKIINEDNIHFMIPEQDSPICLKPNENKLYTVTGWCLEPGIYTVHFIGYGNNTEIMYQTLKIRCGLDNYQEELIHKLHIYDFSPYESIYSLEAEDFSQEVTQIFKRQKLPYRTGKQPFPMNKQEEVGLSEEIKQQLLNQELTIEDIEAKYGSYKNWFEENIESQSFIDQNNQIKNCDDYHYHYISREIFSEEAIESFAGKNLQELVDNINNKSIYFKAQFLKSGSNELLNDFNQYAPNGFLYRMGLLNSELYHVLGVLPEYDYMGDYLFRWAPSPNQLPNLYPKKKGMRWDENIWAGKGWNVYRYITDEYKESDEYKQKQEEEKEINREFLENFNDKKTAKEYVKRLEYIDNIIRNQERSEIIKYDYKIEESYIDNGIFFINIPLAKIPSNFILPTTEELYSIINRAKPYGSKPLIRYLINETFVHDTDFYVKPIYHQRYDFDFGENIEKMYEISAKKIKYGKTTCKGREIDSINEEIYKSAIYSSEASNFDNDIDFNVDIKYKFKQYFDKTETKEGILDTKMEQNYLEGYKLNLDNSLETLEDILELLYQKNNNNISFLLNTELNLHQINNNDNYNIIETKIENDVVEINFIDDLNVKHILKCSNNEYYKMKNITNSIIKNDKEYIIQNGIENISSILLYQNNFLNKKIAIWFAKDISGRIHYFNHEIVNDIIEINRDNTNEPKNNKVYSCYKNPISFETPFFYKQKIITPIIEKEDTEWKNLHRINKHSNTYAYINNITMDSITPDDIEYLFNDINIPETARVYNVFLNLKSASKNKNIYVYNAINTNYLDDTSKTHFLVLKPTNLESYSYNHESPSFYREKLQEYINEDKKILIKKYAKLYEESSLFNSSIDFSVEDYMKDPNQYISIKKSFWVELSEFTNEQYKLNETQSIHLIIEGYNTGKEIPITVQTLSELNFAEKNTTENIPSGYFRKKIDLYYPNYFRTDLFKVRFKFDDINDIVKIFDTRISIEFKQSQNKEIEWDFSQVIDSDGENNIMLLQDINNPYELNNGIGVKLSFDDIIRGEYYHINTMDLFVLYKETEMEMLINKNKYNYVPNNTSINTITGNSYGYPSIEFYNDIVSMSQPKSNIGIDNHGTKLKKSLYQSFFTRDDNITNIEIFPNGVIGNPGENIKIGLYENHENTPGRLIKEVYANGWLKNNPELKNLPSIKYNINVDDLEENQMYWFKIEVINPQENSYYLLKNIDTPQNDAKLLINENNNYINSFSSLQFNIYSKNLSKSFGSIPCLQTVFDNPYIKVGLHKEQGIINNLKVNKESIVFGVVYMSEVFEEKQEEIVLQSIEKKTKSGETTQLSTEG